jgi:insertion element IS1 protein InsB
MPVVLEPIHCPTCNETQIVRHGKSAAGKQRYKCCNPDCSRHSFIMNYTYRGYLPEVKQQISDMAVNGSGIRDTARVLNISTTTVIEELKRKERALVQVNEPLIKQLNPTSVAIVQRVEEAELDELWSFVGAKKCQRWLWHAIDHKTGQILAYVLADHKDDAFKQLKALLQPFGIQHFYSDGWGAYLRQLEQTIHTVGKSNTQKIERKHLTLRTRIKRLARKTICFSKSIRMHDIVLGLFINRFEFARAV